MSHLPPTAKNMAVPAVIKRPIVKRGATSLDMPTMFERGRTSLVNNEPKRHFFLVLEVSMMNMYNLTRRDSEGFGL
jgi:hypothetical protein